MSKWSGNINHFRRQGRSRKDWRRGNVLKNWREGGFTLIESLIVLSIFLIISSIFAFGVKPHSLFLEKQRFMNQLKADLFYSQQYAISHQQHVYGFIMPEQKLYYIRGRDPKDVFIRREIPKEITFEAGTLQLYFSFQPDGNINKFGSIYILVGKDKYRLTFLIGKGRFYVEKE